MLRMLSKYHATVTGLYLYSVDMGRDAQQLRPNIDIQEKPGQRHRTCPPE